MLLVWKLFALNRHSGTLPYIDKVVDIPVEMWSLQEMLLFFS